MKVWIDGIEIPNVRQVNVQRDTEFDNDLYTLTEYAKNRPLVKAEVIGADFAIRFKIAGYEHTGDNVYFYGVFTQLMPELFKSNLEEWQVAYIRASNLPDIMRFKLKTDDPTFKTESARMFKLGWDRGKEIQAPPVEAISKKAPQEFNNVSLANRLRGK